MSSLGVGTHNLLAIYGGDASFNVSTPAIYAQVVNGFSYIFPLIFK